jgi:hypothetical protein
MRPEEIEEMLYDRALRSKIRPRISKRLTNLALGRAVAATAVAGTALLCSLALSSSDASNVPVRSNPLKPSRPQMTDTDQNPAPGYSEPDRLQNTDPITASLAAAR